MTALWAFGVTQPVLTLVDGNPDLLLARDATRLDLLLFAFVVAAGYPLLAVGYCWVVSRLSAWAGDVLYLIALGVALAPFAARAVKLLEPSLLIAILLVALLATGGVVVYARSRAARLFAGFSIVLLLAAATSFVHGLPTLTEDAQAARVEVLSPTPVVLLVLDELPTSSLLTGAGNIDAVRYPAFARLARDGTWYPNATTVHEWTSDAVPAILSGRIGRVSTLPIYKHHPDNLFTLLGDSYEVAATETATQLCPEIVCPRKRQPLTAIVHGIALDTSRLLIPRILPDSFARRLLPVRTDAASGKPSVPSLAGCETSLDRVKVGKERSVFFYCHLGLPHVPWQFLPSGAWYDSRGLDGWSPTEHWGDETWPVLQGYQRHLLQLGYTDRVLGRLLGRLDQAGLYERALVVLVADHGVSFRPGEGRRQVTERNLVDVANVPLFVKAPGQARARVDRGLAQTVDIVPTIADVLGVRLPWNVDGISLVRPVPANRRVLVDLRGGRVARPTLDEIARARVSLVRWKVANFGERRDSLFRIGPNRRLLGKYVADLSLGTTPVEAEIENADQLARVRRSSGFVPVRIFGRLRSGSVDSTAELAVAVNGRIEALTQVFRDGGQSFRALVPEVSLREGANEVEVFLVLRSGARASLARIASTG